MWRLLFPILLLSLTTSAMDPPALLWEREYFSDRSGWFDCVVQTFDGGFAIAASVAGDEVGNRTIIRTDANGDIEWYADNQFHTQFAKWIEQLPDSGFIASGNARVASGDSKGVFLLRVDSDGNTIWSKVYDLTTGQDRAGVSHLSPMVALRSAVSTTSTMRLSCEPMPTVIPYGRGHTAAAISIRPTGSSS